MSTPQGILDTLSRKTAPVAPPPASPFAISPEAPAPVSFPEQFPAEAAVESPFSVSGYPGARKAYRKLLPAECLESVSPFGIPEPQGFGFEAAPKPEPAAGSVHLSDSLPIKQLEIRAIFGVDREMTHDEMLQRCHSLPGVRQLALVDESDVAAVDTLRQVIANLGFGGGPLRIYSGSLFIDFIREGRTLLAVQTDGGFAPGVRETLIIVARELSR